MEGLKCYDNVESIVLELVLKLPCLKVIFLKVTKI